MPTSNNRSCLTLVLVLEVEAGHDLGDAVGKGEHEGGRHLVLLRTLVAQHVPVSLLVVIVDEDQRLVALGESPAGPPVCQVDQFDFAPEHATYVMGMLELRNGSQRRVFVSGDRLTTFVRTTVLAVGRVAKLVYLTHQSS